jgi:hypothetical protein
MKTTTMNETPGQLRYFLTYRGVKLRLCLTEELQVLHFAH